DRRLGYSDVYSHDDAGRPEPVAHFGRDRGGGAPQLGLGALAPCSHSLTCRSACRVIASPRMRLPALVILCGCSFLEAAENPQSEIVAERNVAVPMRDGVILRADILRPSGQDKVPVLVYRTPYGKDAAQQEYSTFRHAVERGYAVVIEDVRGRY